MANLDDLARLKEGVSTWNEWRLSDDPTSAYDLSGADLRDADLSGANLRWSDLSGANLSGANLGGVSLAWADLSGAALNNATLQMAEDLGTFNLGRLSLDGARLSRANLAGATLIGVDIIGADLRDADLSGANIASVVFGNLDLSTARGLEAVVHYGPSTLGIDTLLKSHGKIPESFLRGCGIPEHFITYSKSLITSSVKFHSCFISYSVKNQDFAERLHADLQNEGVRCWFAPHDMKSGRKIHEQIVEAIRAHDRVLLILSEDSMRSGWVKTELAHARQKEISQQRQVLFPVSLATFSKVRDWECFDTDRGIDSAREVREYFIADFSRWKNHKFYQKAFERLLCDLKAQTEKKAGVDDDVDIF